MHLAVFACSGLVLACAQLVFSCIGLDFACSGLVFKCKCIRLVFMFLLMMPAWRGELVTRVMLMMDLHVFAAYILKGCKGVVTIISAVFVIVLLDYVNPAQLWLCGLVRRSVTTVRELGS